MGFYFLSLIFVLLLTFPWGAWTNLSDGTRSTGSSLGFYLGSAGPCGPSESSATNASIATREKKKMRTQFLRCLECPGSVSLPRGVSGLSPPSSLLSLGGQCGNLMGPAFPYCQSAWKCSSVSCPRHPGPVCSQWLPVGSSCSQSFGHTLASQCCFLHGQGYLAALVVWVVVTHLLFCYCYFN